jgi:Holliday junction resolvase RusA-like endonuclease
MLGRSSCQFVALNLPPPVSVNDLWKPVKRGAHASMVRSPQYLSWLTEAGYMLNSQRPGMVEGPYALTIKVTGASKIDLGNVEKSVSDLLQAHGVIENDKFAQKITIERAAVEGMSIMVASTREATP